MIKCVMCHGVQIFSMPVLGSSRYIRYNGKMSYGSFEKLAAVPAGGSPFPHLLCEDFIHASALSAIHHDFPEVPDTGSFPLASLKYGDAFATLTDEIRSAKMADILAQKLDAPIVARSSMITVRDFCRHTDGKIHRDSVGKIITVLLYLNRDWETESGGRLRLLNGAHIDDYFLEIPPGNGALIAFRCDDNAWHGHLPFVGERRAIQLNWVSGVLIVAARRYGTFLAPASKKRAPLCLGVVWRNNMVLTIETFSNRAGSGSGSAFFKAVGHPLCLAAAQTIIRKIQNAQAPAVFDPQNTLTAFAFVHALSPDNFAVVYAQDVACFDVATWNKTTLPITELTAADVLFVPIFDSAAAVSGLRCIAPPGCEIITLDDMRLPARFLADVRRYLNPINFATNLLFFREAKNAHTRLVTANYWSAYGAKEPFVLGRLFAADGQVLVDFEKPLGAAHEIFCLDSAQINHEFNLPDFCGRVFLHIARAAGHDIVKYVADSYGDIADGKTTELSCTHDANSWPADLYAGIPAPDDGDTVVLWAQNSHPSPIPAHAIGVNRMGADEIKTYPEEIPPFATRAIDFGVLLPDARWSAQIEIRAGRRRINHANVERTDLQSDANLLRLSRWLGKGYILPAPILPRARFVSKCLPTPMSIAQNNLPLAAVVYNAAGAEINRQFLGCLPRHHQMPVNLSELAVALGEEESVHVELVYDFAAASDGWLHALFRYTEKQIGHMAETSFGAHMFNHFLTYKNEPQSYKDLPQGLTTRLFLRIAPPPITKFCHLIYPVGESWNPQSETVLALKNRCGEDVAEKTVAIASGGSLAFCCQDIFDVGVLTAAGDGAYIIIRDVTCRLSLAYKDLPPGLTTRLFLRIAPPPITKFCHLIYPVGESWNPQSETVLALKNRCGEDVAEKTVAIASGGSLAFCCQDIFDVGVLTAAGDGAYIIIRDVTCRLSLVACLVITACIAVVCLHLIRCLDFNPAIAQTCCR